jgi:hypothetical protein
MKTTIEINGFEIVIEETDGLITVSAMQDEETIEEFEIQTGAQSDDEGEGDEVQDFGDFEDEGGEESDDMDDMDDMESFGGEEEEEDLDDDSEEEEEEEDDEEGEGKLESFKSFLKKRK